MSEIKRGMMKFYHRGFLSKKWKNYKFILYESSLLTWYADLKHKKPDGMVLLKDVERFICVGPYTKFLPDFPQLENEYDQVALIAFPQSIKERDRNIIWLLCADVDDLNSWMKAIVQTLPSHTLRMERMYNTSPTSLDDNLQSVSGINSPDIPSPERIGLRSDSVGLPLAAGFLATRLQGHNMNGKENPLKKAGYDFGDTLWGVGEGWGYFSPEEVPGFAGQGGSGGYLNAVDLTRTEEDGQCLEDGEEPVSESVNDEDVEQATYELSKNEIDDDEEGEDCACDDESEDQADENDPDVEQIEDELKMIDSDIELEP